MVDEFLKPKLKKLGLGRNLNGHSGDDELQYALYCKGDKLQQLSNRKKC